MRALCCPSSSEAVLTGEIAEFLDGGLSELDAHASMVTENSSELERAGVVIICRGFFFTVVFPLSVSLCGDYLARLAFL